MKGSVKIENVFSIKELEFQLPAPGCYLLSGENGTGKTTLLVALHRIRFSNAFRNSFPKGGGDYIDVLENACITYSINGESVEYLYGSDRSRWAPRPKKNSRILDFFGYTETRFIRADSSRFEPTPKDLLDNAPKLANKDLRDGLSEIFHDNRFDQLMTLSTGFGRSAPAFVVRDTGSKKFYSEKHFSLGEISVIRLVEQVIQAKGGSMVLVDELEMALHPKVQVRLLEYLKRISNKKNITTIVSTHSSSMLRIAGKETIFYLEKDRSQPGRIQCIHPCFPAKATQGIAYAEDVSPDYIFLVEDSRARALLSRLIQKYWMFHHSETFSPVFKVLPVGGYRQVIEFHGSSKDYIFSNNTRIWSFLDPDIETDIDRIRSGDSDLQHLVVLTRKLQDRIRFLPITPEPGIVDYFESDVHKASRELDEYTKQALQVERILENRDFVNIQKTKFKFAYLVRNLCDRTNWSEENAESVLFGFWVEKHLGEADIGRLLGPVFNS